MSDEEASAYCLAVEAAVCARPGHPRPGLPALLGAEDGHIALRWHDEGIPLPLVLETIGEVLRRRQRKLGREEAGRGRQRLYRPLAYLDGAVRERWEELQEMVAPGLRGDETVSEYLRRTGAYGT